MSKILDIVKQELSTRSFFMYCLMGFVLGVLIQNLWLAIGIGCTIVIVSGLVGDRL